MTSQHIGYLYEFCRLYKLYRDFVLAKTIAKHNNLSWEKAEQASNFFNEICTVKESKPQDFIISQDERSNDAIDAYHKLKAQLLDLKTMYGCEVSDVLYKHVKNFYRKKIFGYQMDSFFCVTVHGYFAYKMKLISKETFLQKWAIEYNLFNGAKKQVDWRYCLKMAQYIMKTPQ